MPRTSTTEVTTWGGALDWTKRFKWSKLKSPETCHTYSSYFTKAYGRSMKLQDAAKGYFWMEYQAELQEKHPKWSNATVNRAVSAAVTCIKVTHKAGLHDVRVPDFDRLPEGEARLHWFTKDQVDQLAQASEDRLADAILVSAYTGCRQGELLRLKSDDVDVAAGLLWIGGKPTCETKGRNVRAIPIHPKIEAVLLNRLDQEFLFKNDWANKDQLYNAFKKVRAACGISRDYVWHSLRHSFATWLGEHNHPRAVMELCGHADISTTLRYMKPTDQATKAAILSL